MPDVWATVTQLDPTVQRRLAEVLETRGAEPRQQTLRTDFLGGLELLDGARVLDVGCGTGVLTRRLAALPSVAEGRGCRHGAVAARAGARAHPRLAERHVRGGRWPRASLRGRIVRRGRLRLDAEPRPRP